MNPKIKDRLYRSLALIVVGLCIGAALGYIEWRNKQPWVVDQGSRPVDTSSGMAGVQVGGPFTLVGPDGTPVSSRDFGGSYKLIYFGFTYCPAICPTELQKITAVLKALPPEIADRIQPLFITVDPERDTHEVMKEYVSLFHPRLIGLTGSAAQIDEIKQQYRIYAAKVEDESLSDYTVDHSSYIYLMDPDDQLITVYGISDTAEFVVNDIRGRFSGAG